MYSCKRTRSTLGSLFVSLALLASPPSSSAGRPTASLDGAWSFSLDPKGIGENEAWFTARAPFDASVQVPGAWDAQGFGQETDKLHHHFIGKGWYKREIEIPAGWAGRRVFLCVGGVHRYAKVWVNGRYLGEHIGYLSPFEYDITDAAPPGSKALVAFCVDSEQRWDIDTLTGCFDIIDCMDTYWGGIWGHVTLEGRADAYLRDPYVQSAIAPPGCTVSATVVGAPPASSSVRLVVLSADGATLAAQTIPLNPASLTNGRVAIETAMPGALLWTPDTPALYTARLSLVQGDRVLDEIETRFGLRRITVDGPRLCLNGRRIFLRGYGDDCVYPETMAGPSDKAVYLKRLAVAKAYGFNHVRHHSHFLPPEYYDACDEIGMLVSAEFPIAYQPFYDRAKGPALDLYRHEWTAAITRFRNHPSIFDWCMGNELYKGLPLAPDLYRIAKELDPTRLVVDSDGLPTEGFMDGSRDRDTLDLYFVQFDVFNTPLENPHKFDCPAPRKPVVSHEDGNYVTFPRLDIIEQFQHNFKPFWLTETKDKMVRMGLLDEAPQWAENSEQLYSLCRKVNIEALRKNPNISGYHWWLLQDYWTTSNGLVDAYFRPKPGMDRQKVLQFNADVVLLQDGLGLTYRSGEAFRVTLMVSNIGPSDLANPALHYTLRLGDQAIAQETRPAPQVPQGAVAELTRVELTLPNVEAPTRLVLDASLEAAGARYVNDWSTWVYPAQIPAPPLAIPLFASAEVRPALARWGAKALPQGAPLPKDAVYVSSMPSPAMLDAASAGACLVLLRPQGVFPAAPTRFKTAWWRGDGSDNNAGTVVYDHPVARAMAPDGWCDAGWFRLFDGAQGYLLDEFPATPHVLIRAIEVAGVCRNKALLFETGLGQGCLIVCGLNLDATDPVTRAQCPEAEWLTARLLEYAATLPHPKDARHPQDARRPAPALPDAFIRERTADLPHFEGPLVEGFARLIRNEGEQGTWFTYREQNAPNYICRQTKLGHLVEWETAPVPEVSEKANVTFVFAGGLGWVSQPKTRGFILTVNGTDAVRFDAAQGPHVWKDAERNVVMALFPRQCTSEDTVGLFYVQAPAALLKPGVPCRLAVRSLSAGSQRWFALHPYPDVLADRAKE